MLLAIDLEVHQKWLYWVDDAEPQRAEPGITFGLLEECGELPIGRVGRVDYEVQKPIHVHVVLVRGDRYIK